MSRAKRVANDLTIDLDTLDQLILGSVGKRIAYTLTRRGEFLTAGEGVIESISVHRVGKQVQIYLDRPKHDGTQVVIGAPLDNTRVELTHSDMFEGNPKLVFYFDKFFTLELDAMARPATAA